MFLRLLAALWLAGIFELGGAAAGDDGVAAADAGATAGSKGAPLEPSPSGVS